jgi:hypothetical protein
MHRNNFYLSELEELPDIPKALMNRLTIGTELESIISKKFNIRIWKRIEKLSSTFIRKSYIEREPFGMMQKTERFK